MRKAVLLFCFILLGCFSTPESKFYMLNSLPIEKISSTQMKIGVYSDVFVKLQFSEVTEQNR